ncbi:hypothetical protein CMUST_02875 [Corynebacterium mustelae]|uniref:Uncharacterized protein n=2 Tax=Corynebacterium mustelae TaxID=571915 RepID=A0A0G3GUT3_9CORY|nr:hypothetical protein CMUST_02875 [Corynebacterium mustelae]
MPRAQQCCDMLGKANESVPEIEVPPFPKHKPGSIPRATNGLTYTLVEDVTPAKRELRAQSLIGEG